MIVNELNNATLPNGEAYTEIYMDSPSLVAFRTLPYAFNCFRSEGDLSVRDVRVFMNDSTGIQACSDLVVAIRDFALSNQEQWSEAQLQAVAGAKTLFIAYLSPDNAQMNFRKEAVSKDELEREYTGQVVFVSYDISPEGMVVLVNEFLGYLSNIR